MKFNNHAEDQRRRQCTACGSTTNVASFPDRNEEELCPRCASRYTNTDLAAEHLASQVRQFLPAWIAHWSERGLTPVDLRRVVQGELVDELVQAFNEALSSEVQS